MKNNPFPSREYELLARLQSHFGSVEFPYLVGTGDDAAVRQCSGEKIIITADISVEEIHFSLRSMTLEETGYRAMVSNISDCAAMGAVPDGAVIQLVFPRSAVDLEESIDMLYRGFGEACKQWKFPIIGGDLSYGPVWILGITVLGRIAAGSRHMLRKGIIAGDQLWCTGYPGRSAAGFEAIKRWGRTMADPLYQPYINKHIHPEPRVELGLALAACPDVHAMMDLSDGLSKDCRTFCYENGLGCMLETGSSQPPAAIVQLSRETGIPWTDLVLHGGEDYELLFAAAPSFDPSKLTVPGAESIVRLGYFTSEFQDLLWRPVDGVVQKVEHQSWDHVQRSSETE
jgi:thiamine-monophosphate kinase